MQNNGIFGVNLLLFPVKTKTEIKYSPRVIQLVPQRCLLGCGSSMNKQICLTRGLTSPRSIQRVEAWLKHKRTLQTLIWSWPQGPRHLTTCHPPSVSVAYGQEECSLVQLHLLPSWLCLPARDNVDGLKNDILRLLCHCSESLTGIFSFNLHNNLMR